MSEEDQSSKTEEPSAKKISDARLKGNVPLSKEIGTAMSYVSLLVMVSVLIPYYGPDIALGLKEVFIKAPTIEVGEGTEGIGDAGMVVLDTIMTVIPAVIPFFILMVFAAIASVVIQGQFVVSLERIKPSFKKINPISGLKRLFSANNLVEFAKNITKVTIVAVAVWIVASPLFDMVAQTPEINLRGLFTLGVYVERVLWAIVIFVLPVALADLFWQRYTWYKKMRMTIKEVRDEHKDSEGNPQVKAKIAELRRQGSRRRMMSQVKTATVVLTNPTHYSVALRYDQLGTGGPVCVAKGVDLIALKIREEAAAHGVTVIESPPLARALFAQVELDQEIPYEHWEAVAKIIAFVMDINAGKKVAPPEGATLHSGRPLV